MAKKKRRRGTSNRTLKVLGDIRKGALGLTTASVTTTIGADVITRAGAHGGAAAQTAAASGAGAMTTMAGFYPAMGTMIAGGGALKMLGTLEPKGRKKKVKGLKL